MAQFKKYSEMIRLKTFEERFEYLKLDGFVGSSTFGYERYLNQEFYHSKEWKRVKREVIIRDLGKDLGIMDTAPGDKLIIHHMNPITTTDLYYRTDILMNPEYLITVTDKTHRALHYGTKEPLYDEYVERQPNDTCPWKH